MDIWRKGSFKSSKLLISLSTSKHKILEPERGALYEVKHPLQDNEQQKPMGTKHKMVHGLGDLRLQSLNKHNLDTSQAPQKPPRLHLNSSEHANVQEYSTSLCALPSVSSASTCHQYQGGMSADAVYPSIQTIHKITTAPQFQISNGFLDQSDSLLSFNLDLGPSLLDGILQMLSKRSRGDNAASNCLSLLGLSGPDGNGNYIEEL
ncbi:uncharacterized protein C15orf62 homolog, mitochondrial [Rhinatrema bivittatum]|uniref:uncharacterized protein C15orf62 homolog, mitochondrial n=1 Tax=Rhinatrema bivittatum TaxID=194408 RepID=UPI0011284FB1|nr:uncharacterized protein C15orf62 homolog, mitochondrial [Rhinatrema bivittatum]